MIESILKEQPALARHRAAPLLQEREQFLSHLLRQGTSHRLLPALAAYMGQAGLGSTERYLSMTPERFRKQLVKLSPQRRKRRWSDNPALMRFLAEL